MRRLYLLRHAKSAWPDGVADFDRPLAPRGIEAAGLVGTYLRQQGIAPARILVSTARRTRETLRFVREAWQPEAATIREELRIYAASAATLLAIAREGPAAEASLMLIGHNPGMAELAMSLSDPQHAAADDFRRMLRKFPTAALAVIDFPQDDWRIVPGAGRLIRFVTPKQLGGRDED
jgi:phosphohistidine phosphatase